MKRVWKKWIAVVMTAALALSLPACSSGSSSAPGSAGSAAEEKAEASETTEAAGSTESVTADSAEAAQDSAEAVTGDSSAAAEGAATAREIMSSGETLEEYLDAVHSTDVAIDYGTSGLYTQEELEEAAVQVKCRFAAFEGCELHSLRYAGDESCNEENLAWMNELDEGKDYVQVVEFLTDFHSPVEGGGAWEADKEYKDYQWWLARTADGGWQLLTFGY